MFGIFKNMFSQTDDSQLAKAIEEGAFLVDVRTPGEFASGSVKGAVNIPLDSIASQLPKLKGKKGIVVFCRSGSRSGQAKNILEQHGITQVVNGGTWQHVNQVIHR